MAVKTGIDVVLDGEADLALDGVSIGLITNQTGVTSDLDYNREALLDAGFDLRKLYCPEHGLWGLNPVTEDKSEYTDDLTGLPCHSLFVEHRTPTAEMLEGIDVLLFDIQDVGVRCWTYTSTMINCMRAAAEREIPYIVLDRPNPLTGTTIEGRPLDAEFESFTGHRGLPMRYGLTIGELARFANAEYDIGTDLEVVELQGWNREQWFDETGLLWGPSLPALFSVEKALIYPGTVLLEGTNVASGDGWQNPTMVAAPWMDSGDLVADCRERFDDCGLDGVKLRKAKYKSGDGVYRGFQLHVSDRDVFEPFETGLVVLRTVMDRYPSEFEWTNEAGFDNLAGTNRFRELLEDDAPVQDLLNVARSGLAEYEKTRDEYLLYP